MSLRGYSGEFNFITRQREIDDFNAKKPQRAREEDEYRRQTLLISKLTLIITLSTLIIAVISLIVALVK